MEYKQVYYMTVSGVWTGKPQQNTGDKSFLSSTCVRTETLIHKHEGPETLR
jgi:hypothetical protein